MSIISASGDQLTFLPRTLATLAALECKVVSNNDIELVDSDEPSALNLLALLFLGFSSWLLLLRSLVSSLLFASLFHPSFFFSYHSCIMFKHCALVRILVP